MSALDVRFVLRMASFTLDVAFVVPPGVTVLFGPSGAGKSRTLGCIAGIVRPDRGRIALGDEIWFDGTRNQRPIHQRRAAYVFQSLALFPHLTAAANVEFGIPREHSRADRAQRAREMLGRMRVGHLADRKPGSFSGGEAQRVALARAFAMEPRVLLLDEPFSALDEGVKTELLAEVSAWIARAPIPVVLVTHHPGEAEQLGDRTVHLQRGTIVSEVTATPKT